jgi:hypothetical protein
MDAAPATPVNSAQVSQVTIRGLVLPRIVSMMYGTVPATAMRLPSTLNKVLIRSPGRACSDS